MPTLGVYSPWGGGGGPKHEPVCQYLSVDRASHKGISSTHFVGGRGSAKTTAGGQLVHRIAYHDMPGAPLFWTEPREADLQRVFLPMLEMLVPKEHWDFIGTPRPGRVRFSSGTVLDLISRNVDNPRKKVGIGPTYAGGWVDEAAEKFTIGRWNDLKNSVRLDGVPYRFIDSLSTPVMNGYYELCMRPGHKVIHASSYDNPFISRDAIDSMVADMGETFVAQEIEGQWIRHEGRVWKSFSEEDYPNGNMHTAEWDDARPWHLGMDLGQGFGHWQIWQYHGVSYPDDERRVAVVVAEGMQRQQPIQPVLSLIKDVYGQHRIPATVAAGSDVGTLGSTGPPPARLLAQMGWPCRWPTGELSDKSTQHQAMERLIFDTTGARRWAISKNLQRHGPKGTWGILNCMRVDTFPEPGQRSWFVKDKASARESNCEDPRDSMLYLAVINHPPIWSVHDRQAA